MKTYFVLVKQKIQKKWYMIMTMKQSKTKPSDLRTVSYTHLDVYKRQVVTEAAPPATEIF